MCLSSRGHAVTRHGQWLLGRAVLFPACFRAWKYKESGRIFGGCIEQISLASKREQLCHLFNKICPRHFSAAVNNCPPTPVPNTANETHHGVHVNSPWCRGLGRFSVVGDFQGGLVCCLSRADDREDNSCGLSDRWDDTGWQFRSQYFLQLTEVLSGLEYWFSARYMFKHVPEKRVLWGSD